MSMSIDVIRKAPRTGPGTRQQFFFFLIDFSVLKLLRNDPVS